MTKPFISEKFLCGMLASFGVVTPVLIFFARLRLMCPTLELQPLAFLPLSGAVNGRYPHLFCRVMHDLTHPIFLLGYAAGLTYVAMRSIDRPLGVRSNQLLFCGLALFHLAFIVSYFIT